MSTMPFFQFYPSDWLGDVKLQACSIGAQGLLINMMCLMHQSTEYGVLLISGHIPDTKTIAKLCHVTPRKFEKLFQELTQNEVLRIREDGAIFCKRMIKDQEVREQKSKAGAKGGNPRLVNQQVKQEDQQQDNQPVNEVDKPISSEVQKFREENTNTHPVPTREVVGPDEQPQGGEVSDRASPSGKTQRPSSHSDPYGAMFEAWWAQYPRQEARGAAREEYLRAVRFAGVDQFELLDALEQHKQSEQWRKENGRYVPRADRWLKDERWNDELPSARDGPYDAVMDDALRYFQDPETGEDDVRCFAELQNLDPEELLKRCKSHCSKLTCAGS